jgi:hypothetical protein
MQIRTNTIFEVVKAADGRTAWTDKYPAHDRVNGPSDNGVDNLSEFRRDQLSAANQLRYGVTTQITAEHRSTDTKTYSDTRSILQKSPSIHGKLFLGG